MIKKIIIVTVLILLLGLFYSLGKQVYEALKIDSRLNQENEELISLQKKNNELKKKLADVQTPGFIEKGARNKLNLSRPDETVLIIPKTEIDKVLGVFQEKKEEIIPNWQGWLRLFWK